MMAVVKTLSVSENFVIDESLIKKDLITFPKELDKKCTPEEFHKMMTSHNSDIPIGKVVFEAYPENKTGL